ncbi:hypothetical protein [Dongia sp. agr-C8]
MMQGRVLKAFGLISVMILTQAFACADPRGQSNARIIRYDLTAEERVIDPLTGETVITSHWEYEDGYKTTTVKRIPRGNEVRRWDRARPEPRVTD